MAKIKKQSKPETIIPTASMSDIAFLLLIFFMVSTVFVKERGLRITMPKAHEENIKKIPRKNAVTVYVNRSGKISIDDRILGIPMISPTMQRKLAENFNMIVAFRTDTKAEYGVMADIMNKLREADALSVTFEAKKL